MAINPSEKSVPVTKPEDGVTWIGTPYVGKFRNQVQNVDKRRANIRLEPPPSPSPPPLF